MAIFFIDVNNPQIQAAAIVAASTIAARQFESTGITVTKVAILARDLLEQLNKQSSKLDEK